MRILEVLANFRLTVVTMSLVKRLSVEVAYAKIVARSNVRDFLLTKVFPEQLEKNVSLSQFSCKPHFLFMKGKKF